MQKDEKKQKKAAYLARKQEGGIYAIVNKETGTFYLELSTDLTGSHNRFSFSQMTDLPPYGKLREDWLQFGKDAFSFEILQTLAKKEDQSAASFRADLDALYDLSKEQLLTSGVAVIG